MTTSLGNFHTNHIFLTSNGDYARNLLKLLERTTLHQKRRVMLLAHRQNSFSQMLNTNPLCLMHLDLAVHPVNDIESTPNTIISCDLQPLPDIIIFDLHSIIMEMLQRPVIQQCSTETLVRHIAKCSAAFSNYREMVSKAKQEKGVVDTIVVMPKETYPMTPAQFKLLIGLYFYGHECHTNFSKIAACINVSQGLK